MSAVATIEAPAAGDWAEPSVRLRDITHAYGDQTVLHGVSLDIAHGELLTLLGPSGCGKTTLLRIIAGFERPADGRVLLEGEDVTSRPAHRRATNMVFQRPTLFPHLDVFANVAFGLRVARVAADEQRRRVREALELVRLGGFERRRSHELSGGQMQRVALARALVNRPAVLLLDEPLSSLDLKIRLEMEVELRRMHRETGATFVYVTHDQREAMALSDRLVVMNEGRVEQIGQPHEVYRRPSSPFAASFVGDANVLPVEVRHATGEGVALGIGDFEGVVPDTERTAPGPAWLVLRPEVVRVVGDTGDADGSVRGVVRDFAFRGTGFSYRVAVGGLELPVKAEVPATAAPHPVGSPVRLDWEPQACSLLPRAPDETTPPDPSAEEAP